MDEIAAVMKLMGSDPTESEIRDMVNQVRDYLIESNYCLNAPVNVVSCVVIFKLTYK